MFSYCRFVESYVMLKVLSKMAPLVHVWFTMNEFSCQNLKGPTVEEAPLLALLQYI